MNIIRLLAWRYIYGIQNEKTISLMVKVCFWGMCIGTFSLTLILAIMNGFEKMTHAQLQGIHAQIIMRAYGNELNIPAITMVLQKEFPEVTAWSPSTVRQAIVTSTSNPDISNVVMVKGVDPLKEAATSTLEHKLVEWSAEHTTLQHLLDAHHVIIGSGLAKMLDVGVGDTITVLSSADEQPHKATITFEQHSAIVSGLFTTGIEDIDTAMLVCSLPFLHTLWPSAGIEQLNLTISPHTHESTLLPRLRNRLHLDVYSWKDLYPALVAALSLEKWVMFFILALICLVASMNILSLAFMHITQKRSDIAILKTLGVSDMAICSIFLIVSISTATVGALCGLVLAVGAGWLLQTYPFIKLPDSYYFAHLPVCMELHHCILVFVFVVVLSSIAAWIPVSKTKTVSIADMLRNEGY